MIVMIALHWWISPNLACGSLHLIARALTIAAPVLCASCVAPLHLDSKVARGDGPQWVATANPAPPGYQMPDVPSSVISFDTSEGTLMNVDVSPDGVTLVFDLLGDIYRLPIDGGEAVPLTSGRAWDQAPRFSSDGTQVYFVSDREGFKNIWRLTLSDQSVQRVTRADSDIMGGPSWSQDGDHLLASIGNTKYQNSEIILHSIDPNNGNMTPIDAPDGPWIDLNSFETLRPRTNVYSATQSADGEVFFDQIQFDQQLGRNKVRIFRFNIHTRVHAAITALDAEYNDYGPQLSHDGTLLAYFRQYPDRRTEVRILNRTNGQDEPLVDVSNTDDSSYGATEDTTPNYAFTPDDRQLILSHGGKIHRVSLVDGLDEVIPFRATVEREVTARLRPSVQQTSETGEASVIRWPSLSRDGRRMAFAAIGYVWVMDLETGLTRRLTSSINFETMPALSPDGLSVAFISFTESKDDYWPGHLMVAEIDSGTPRRVLAAPNETYLLPRWSEDASMIAVIREVQGESRREAAFGWTAVASGVFREVALAPASSDPLLGWFVYSRFVGFDEEGKNLLFSFSTSRTETSLATAALDGGARRTLATGTSEIGGITPSPDLNNLALTRRDGTVWVVPFNAQSEQSQVSTLSSDAHRISSGGGYYLDWNDRNQVSFGFAQNVFRYRLDGSSPESLRVKVPFAKPKAAKPIAFTGARIITMSDDVDSIIESGTLVLAGRHIATVGPVNEVAIPADARTIDATGRTIMPGLLDTHYHRIGGGSLSALGLPNTKFNDQSAIGYGITTAWEPGAMPNDGVPAIVDLQAAGRILGPRWSFSATGGVGYPWEHLTSYSSALAAIKQHKELGVAVLKEYNTPTRQQRQWLAAAAYQESLGMISHIESLDGVMTRAVDGYSGGDHPYIPVPFFKDVQELLRQTGYIWTPNIVITSATVGAGQELSDYFCNAVVEWKNRTDPRVGEIDPICPPDPVDLTVPYETHRASRVARQAASAARGGVHIGVSAHNMPGSNLHREMWYLWKGGMPIEDVLRATTIGNAEKLGLQEEVGSLEVGKMADFLVLDENPLDDILNTLSLKYTVQGGVVYDSATAERVDVSSIVEAANDVATGWAKTGTDD